MGEIVYVVYTYAHNYTEILKVFKNEEDAEAYITYYKRNFFNKCYIEEHCLE